ncbi:MAG: DNA mismatch repair protein MutL [Acidobacteria bacterium]|nr:MAG: DNA mismatch repair protein MutL [Acidobacteriota bacterium]
MGRVRVLPDKLANQIAAGEVVERPVSALKELVENALDAHATSIKVTVDAGGKRRIRVEDDGVGMDREDCLMALERHATSKLNRSEDLFSIKTLGFRGEALPSIASVSRLTLESRQKEAEHGHRVTVHGSKIKDLKEIQKMPGTTVTVDQLFFNMPARRKFMRKTETELSWIVNLMTTYSFAHTDKFFSLTHNGKTLFRVTPVKTLKERIYQHYGKPFVDDLLPFQREFGPFKLHGLLSKPHVRKTSRNFQYLFVNGRLVRDKVLNHAIYDAYREFGETRHYPIIFLFLECPSDEVDVNVHPAKTEIKFIHPNDVHDHVRDTLKAVLVQIPQTTPWKTTARPEFNQRLSPAEHSTSSQEQEPQVQTRFNFSRTGQSQDPGVVYQKSESTPYSRFIREHGQVFETETQNKPVIPPDQPSQETVHEESPRVLAQYNDSFILAQEPGALLLIDQHVAHERILYDQVLESYTSGQLESQMLLIPQTFELTRAQSIRLEESMDFVRSFGFDIDRFDSQTYVVREVPAIVSGGQEAEMVVELIEKALGNRGETKVEAMIQHLAATRACKAAVKINMRLSLEKMQHLVDQLWKSKTPLFCPHGRPIVLRFTDEEIEKNFLRR